MKQLETVKLPLHSLIDVITNSSTEIFVHSEKSVQPAKDLLQELLKMEGSDKKVDDVFEISIEIERLEEYFEYYAEDDFEEELDGLNYKEKHAKLKEIAEEVKSGKRQLPDDFENYHVETMLVVKTKDKKYQKLVDLLIKLLYSPEWYEHSSD